MNVSHYSEYGIVMNDKTGVTPFSGDVLELPAFKSAFSFYLNSKNCSLPTGRTDVDWMVLPQMHFALKSAHLVVLTDVLLDDDSGFLRALGYKVGDISLTSSQRRKWLEEKGKSDVLKQLCVNVLRQHIPRGSAAEACIIDGYNAGDFIKMWFDFLDFYEGQLLHNCMAHAQRYVALFADVSAPKSSIILLDQITRFESDFFKIMKADQRLPGEIEADYNIRWIKAVNLWQFLVKMNLAETIASDKTHVKTFLMKAVRENLSDPYHFNLAEEMVKFRNFISSHTSVPAKAPTAVKDQLVSDKSLTKSVQHINTLNRVKILEKQLAKEKSVNATFADKAKSAIPTADKKRSRNGVGPCSLCKSLDHDLEHCYKNKNASEAVLKRGAEWRARNPQANMVESNLDETDDSLVAMNTSSLTSGIKHKLILLDGGSDCVLFNRYHYNLLFSLKPHECALSGIGGNTGLRISHKGDIIFMGAVIHDVLYCPDVDKSVVSEGLLCSRFGYKIAKEEYSCILTNDTNKTTFTLQLDHLSMQYIIPTSLFDVNIESHAINLASVRPSNLKTLWHGRFGHAYMGLIIKMARSKIYSDRGLKLPDVLLKVDPDEDLCDACALGKPTFSFSYTQQFRSEIKGKLWYFDVSGGGNLTPSLVHKKPLYIHVC